MIPAWIDATQEAQIPTGLSVDHLLRRAFELRERLRAEAIPPAAFHLDAESVETLHALATVLDQVADAEPKVLLADASEAFALISALDWPEGEFGGRQDLLSRLAFLSWRYARQAEIPIAESAWCTTYSAIDNSSVRFNAEQTLATPPGQRLESGTNVDDPEQLLYICERVRQLGEVEPARARDEAEFFYKSLETHRCPFGGFDERDYFLGEFAYIAGGTCRILARRAEARRWFDRSEMRFRAVIGREIYLCRLSYQRLALLTEERQFGEVLELLPQLVKTLESYGMADDALKCRFLEGQALIETEQLPKAINLFREVSVQAKELGIKKLLAWAYVNLLQIYANLGEVEHAFELVPEATLLLRSLDNRIGLAKIQLGLGFLLRSQGKWQESIEAYRVAQQEFAELAMRADIAAIQLIVAELLLEMSEERQAEWEIRAALPVIDEYQLVPEGVAALSLLRESVRRRQVDRRALRDLHGYLRNPNG